MQDGMTVGRNIKDVTLTIGGVPIEGWADAEEVMVTDGDKTRTPPPPSEPTELHKKLDAMIPQVKEQHGTAMTGDLLGYVIASRCRTFYLHEGGTWPWQTPIARTDIARLCFSREAVVDLAESLLTYIRTARVAHEKHPEYSEHEGFNPARYAWKVGPVGCSTLREPPWYITKDFEPVTIYDPKEDNQ